MKLRLLLAVVAGAAIALLVTSVGDAQRPAVFDLKFGSLSGAKELGGIGDPDAIGTASGTIVGDDQLCYAFTVKNTDQPVAAHIHRGTRTQNGPIVIPLQPPSAGDPGTVSACTTADPAVLEDLRIHPSRYYWNIHTTAHPGGALRGQVFNQR